MNMNTNEIEGIIRNTRTYIRGGGPDDLAIPERETSKIEVEEITIYKM
jgi:hypothetical protein